MKKKKTNIKTIIRQIVREEVAMAIREVITELKQPTIQKRPIPQKRQVTKAIGKEVNFSKNPIINEVLQETADSGMEEWKTMGGGTYDSNRANEIMSNEYGDMMNSKMNNSDVIAPGAPTEVKNIFDKDFSGILKASIKKTNGKR